ncbi:carbohydrate ABC transporter permease [Luxibacter massiliensis]|uniref:carbohydrate ABC transporter permease n=1 Tax=Luxibacter massiliensis TaxID=2219695 RepID=UPI001F3AB641|nr:sugar ABC transporter permease [Luxibacter massiliensis]
MKKKMTLSQKHSRAGWLFLAPAVILIIIFMFYPIIQSFVSSFQSGIGEGMSWAGVANYKRMFLDPKLKKAIINTFIFALWQVPIMLGMALFLAAVLNSSRLRFKPVFRTLLFLPCTMSLVAYAIVFKLMFATNGIINDLLLKIGVIDQAINFLGDAFWAKVVLILSLIWRWVGYNMIFYVTGLTNIDQSLYEAAQIDGASPVQAFRYITVPLLKPVLLLTVIMATNGNLQLFDEPYNLTAGGPGNATISISQYIYEAAFKSVPNFGYACAIGFTLMVVIAVLVIIQMKVGDSDD